MPRVIESAIGSISGVANFTANGQKLLNTDRFSRINFVVSGLTSETVSIQISPDQGVWSASLKPTDMTTAAAASAVTLGNGTYSLQFAAQALRFVKSATTETPTITYCLNNT